MIHGRLVFYTVKLGCRSLFLYKMRSSLTILGVIFGVGSVIAMLAIGEGASQAAEDLIRSLGSRNVILNSVKPAAEENNNQSHSCGIRYGLQYMDLHRMHQSIPHIKQIIPLRLLPKEAHFAQKTISVTVYSTLPVYQEVRRLSLRKGRFLSDIDQENASNVCVISETLARALFAYRDPLEQSIKIDRFYYKVVGILKSAQREMTDKVASATYLAVYIPLSTGKARFGETLIRRVSGSISMETVELHRVIVQCDDIAPVEGYSSCNRKIVATPTHKKADYSMHVPLEQLNKEKKTKIIFTTVLGSIAAISLLVGGVRIMNIMLASVIERTREIGIRRALGARKLHIILQFLVETMLLSLVGGLLGLLFGINISLLVSAFTPISTSITWWALLLALGTSAIVGIVFGLYPARRAANLNPIEALRHE